MYTEEFMTAFAVKVAKQVLSELPSKPTQSKENDPIFTIEKLAAYLGVSKSWVNKRTGKRNEIPHIKVGGHLMFRKTEIDAWLAKQRVPVVNQLSAGLGKRARNG